MGIGKVAVAVIHGIGKQKPGFEEHIKTRLYDLCRKDCGENVEQEIVIEGIHWGSVLNSRQQHLRDRIDQDERARPFGGLRDFLISFATDAVAYREPSGWVYKGVHTCVAMSLRNLMQKTAPDAPLFIIAHSLGSVIASNYLYDLQTDYRRNGKNRHIPAAMRHVWKNDPTPLEQGRTLTMLYTLGSPIGLWSLRFVNDDANRPIDVPPPSRHDRYRGIQDWHFANADVNLPQGWHNWYDPDDIIGYPLAGLNDAYAERVQDKAVQVGGLVSGRTPLAHTQYFTDNDVVKPIARNLVETWQAVTRGDIALTR